MRANFTTYFQKYLRTLFLIGILLFALLYSFPTLTTKPAYWYDEAMNVEIARNFAEFGALDLIVAPNTFSGHGALVGSTGYPVTLPLAGVFKLFGFGLAQARIYMLLWMSAAVIAFFYIAQKLWGARVAYGGTLLFASFAPFYGNGRSVMGEIPGFLFFLLSFFSFERRKFCLAGILLGLAVVSKPSVFVFLIPAFMLVALCRSEAWKTKLRDLLRLGGGALLALVPWFLLYAEEFSRGGLGENILAHFKNPYQEAGVSVWMNVSHNLGTFFQSTTLLYFTTLLALVGAALYLNRELFRAHRNIFILSAVYIPLALAQYLKSFGYLRYLIAAEFLIFTLFLIVLPVLARRVAGFFPSFSKEGIEGWWQNWIPVFTGMTVGALVVFQTVHLFWFSDLYSSEKTKKTIFYLSSAYPDTTVGVMNVPQIGSLLPTGRKYQYLSTYGLWQFGTNSLSLSEAHLPAVIVMDSENELSSADKNTLRTQYDVDANFLEGFPVYRKKQ